LSDRHAAVIIAAADDPVIEPVQSSTFPTPNVPIITRSGALGSNHFIHITVNQMALEDLMIVLPQQMENFDTVRILDQSGKDIPAQISVSKERVTITFDQPVVPGGDLEVLFTGVQMRTSAGEILLYGVTAKRVGLSGEIPIGTARVQIPSRS
jgi:hypothetical protein